MSSRNGGSGNKFNRGGVEGHAIINQDTER